MDDFGRTPPELATNAPHPPYDGMIFGMSYPKVMVIVAIYIVMFAAGVFIGATQ